MTSMHWVFINLQMMNFFDRPSASGAVASFILFFDNR